MKMLPHLNRIFKQGDFKYIASTGAAIAIIGYFLAKFKALPFYYVESIARQSTLSLTAKILILLGLKQFFVQSEGLATTRRTLIPHPINEFHVIDEVYLTNKNSFKIFVALGTIQEFEFPRAIELVRSMIVEADSISWQVGCTKCLNLPGSTYSKLNRDEFLQFIETADVVVCHAGVGILIDCFKAGKKPVVIPRRGKFREHVDDHQVEIMNFLISRNLVSNLEINQSRDIFKASAGSLVGID
jgi:UDP-N-acetylglucosamine transferase subunit ALG13